MSVDNTVEPYGSHSFVASVWPVMPSSAFIKKLWSIINDDRMQQWIHWSEDGSVICIPKESAFSSAILPQYFKHSNWQSFIRQLNMYGFRRVYVQDASERDGSTTPVQRFQHAYFQRHNFNQLSLIKRRSQRWSVVSQNTSSQTTGQGATSTSPPKTPSNNNNSSSSSNNNANHASNATNANNAFRSRLETMMEHVTRSEHMQNAISQEVKLLHEFYKEQKKTIAMILQTVTDLCDVYGVTMTDALQNAYALSQVQQESSRLALEPTNDPPPEPTSFTAHRGATRRLPSLSEVISAVESSTEYPRLAPLYSVSPIHHATAHPVHPARDAHDAYSTHHVRPVRSSISLAERDQP